MTSFGNTIDFQALLKEAQTAGQALPNGDYDFVVDEATATTASTGSPMIKVKLRITTGAHANKKVFNNFVLSVDSPVALSIFFRHMAALGVGPEFFAQLGTVAPEQALAPVAAAILGRTARMTLGQREWPANSGNYRNEVNNIVPGGQPGAVTPPPAAGVPTPNVGGATPFTPMPGVAAPAMPMPAAPVPSAMTGVPTPPLLPTAPPPTPPAPPVSAPPVPAPQPVATAVPPPQPAPAPEPTPAPAPTPQPTVTPEGPTPEQLLAAWQAMQAGQTAPAQQPVAAGNAVPPPPQPPI